MKEQVLRLMLPMGLTPEEEAQWLNRNLPSQPCESCGRSELLEKEAGGCTCSVQQPLPDTGEGLYDASAIIRRANSKSQPFYTQSQLDAAVQAVQAKYDFIARHFCDIENPGIGDDWKFWYNSGVCRTYDSLDALVTTELPQEKP